MTAIDRAPAPVPRAEVENRARAAESCSLSMVNAALERLDFREVELLLYARAKRHEPIPAEVVTRILPCLDDTIRAGLLIALADGPRTHLLLQQLERDAFPKSPHGYRLRANALYLAWQLRENDDARSAAAIQARLVLHDSWHGYDALPAAIVQALQSDLADDGVDEMLGPGPPSTPELDSALQVLRLFGTSTRAKLANYSDLFDAAHPVTSAVTTVQVLDGAVRAGRNEPCPCGSGVKFKRCHGAGDGVTSPPTRAARVQLPSPPRRPGDLADLTPPDLATLDPKQIDTDTLQMLIIRFFEVGAGGHAERAVEEFCRRQVPEESKHEARLLLARWAIRAGDHPLARRQLRMLPATACCGAASVDGAAVAIATGETDALEQLLRVFDLAVRDYSGATIGTLAAATRDVSPALSILMTRAHAMTGAQAWVTGTIEHVRRLRVRLGVPVIDPVEAIHASLKQDRLDDAEREQMRTSAKVEADALRRALGEAQTETSAARRRADHAQDQVRQLANARPTIVVPLEPEEVRALRAKIDELQQLIRERNLELAAVRGRTKHDEPEPRRLVPDPIGVEDENDLDVADDIEPTTPSGRPTPTAWSTRARESLASVPQHVARQALRTATELAGTEPSSWRQVKKPKGTRPGLMMCRVGIHHRMLFETSPDELTVIELITRAALLQTLKRY